MENLIHLYDLLSFNFFSDPRCCALDLCAVRHMFGFKTIIQTAEFCPASTDTLASLP